MTETKKCVICGIEDSVYVLKKIPFSGFAHHSCISIAVKLGQQLFEKEQEERYRIIMSTYSNGSA